VRGLKYGIGILILLLLLRGVDYQTLLAAVSLISLSDILILLALSYLLIAVSVLKWSAFLKQRGISEGFHRLCGLYLVGYFVNLLMPSYIGGDVVRALKVGDKSTDKEAAFSATLLERYTGLAAMLVLASVSLAFSPFITAEITLLTALIVTVFVIGSAAGFLGVGSTLTRSIGILSRFSSIVERIEKGMRLGVSNRALLVKAALLSLLFHCLTIVNTVAVAHAVGWDSPPWLDLFVVVPLILLVGAIPLSPQGLGIQEGAFFYFLHSVGATEGQALAIGLVLRAKSYLLAMIGGIVWFCDRRRSSNQTTSEGVA
jgi:uncharacterized protein (TIRG00374 family)